ncbi:266_t:CDS:2 [Acaulospora morrowiae]|uniref:266_t:CDS:1 n=1 Tax=Acaulospora morrowiae TaxID=94023 RepID=A0A9N9ENY2_9GLOM|nr:266_t:CDS:2 [Acaulospora morrowiae]
MSFYSQWYEQSVCLRGNNGAINRIGEKVDVSAGGVQVDLTPIQVTISSVKNRLIYNEQYKPSESTSLDKKIHTRESSVASNELKTSSSHVGAAANSVAARFVMNQNHSRRHSRQGSSVSDLVYVTPQTSLWDDWLVKYIHEDANTTNSTDTTEEASMEQWRQTSVDSEIRTNSTEERLWKNNILAPVDEMDTIISDYNQSMIGASYAYLLGVIFVTL